MAESEPEPGALQSGAVPVPEATDGSLAGAGAEAVPIRPSRHALYGEHWGEGAARCFSLEADILDEDHAVRLMPVPDSFVCPISAAIMLDPVATVDGCVYERSYIERWFRERRQQGHHITSPITGLELPSATLMPLVALQRAIEVYLAHRPELKQEHMAGRSFEEAAQILQTDLFEKQAEHATSQDKLRRLKQANRVLLRSLKEAEAHILRLELTQEGEQPLAGAVASQARPGGSAADESASTEAATEVLNATFALNAGPGQAATRAEVEQPAAGFVLRHGERSSRQLWRERHPLACLSKGSPFVVPVSLALTFLLLGAMLAVFLRETRLGAAEAPSASSSIEGLLQAAVPEEPARSYGSPAAGTRQAVRPLAGPGERRQPLAVIRDGAEPGASLSAEAAEGTSSKGIRDASAVQPQLVAEPTEPEQPDHSAKAIALASYLEQLNTGTAEEKQQAAFTLRNFAAELPENRIAISRAGAIRPLVALLGEATPRLREEAARALWNLARNSKEIDRKNQIAISRAGAIEPLVKLLEDEEPRVRVVSAAVLNDLAADNVENQVAVARAGAIGPLIKLLKPSEETPALSVMATSLLRSLTANGGDPNIALALIETVPALLALLQCDTDRLAQDQAASLLGAFAAYSSEIQKSIVEAGAIAPLVERLLQGDRIVQGTAVLALRNLAAGNVENVAVAIVRAGALQPLIHLLQDGMPGVRENAADALWILAKQSSENKAAIIQNGATMPRILALLKGKVQEQAMAAVEASRGLEALQRGDGQRPFVADHGPGRPGGVGL